MKLLNNPFHQLAARVKKQEAGAAGDFRRETRPHLERMVRHYLRHRKPLFPWEKTIDAEVDLLLSGNPETIPTDQVVTQVASRLCEGMIDCLQTAGRPQDTLVFGKERHNPLETLLACG